MGEVANKTRISNYEWIYLEQWLPSGKSHDDMWRQVHLMLLRLSRVGVQKGQCVTFWLSRRRETNHLGSTVFSFHRVTNGCLCFCKATFPRDSNPSPFVSWLFLRFHNNISDADVMWCLPWCMIINSVRSIVELVPKNYIVGHSWRHFYKKSIKILKADRLV